MELKNWKLFLLATLLSIECFAQQTIAPFKTQQANTVFYVNMGNTTLTTIQKTVTAACAYSTATLVDILPGSNPSDTIAGLTSACATTAIYDQRSSPAANYTCSSGGCTLVIYPVSGTAGGDLEGTYPNPTVKGSHGLALPVSAVALGTNSAGGIITATLTGTGTKVASSTGSTTGFNMAMWNSAGDTVDSGVARDDVAQYSLVGNWTAEQQFVSILLGSSSNLTGVTGNGASLAATAGTFTSGNLRSTNVNSNEVDSGLAVSNVPLKNASNIFTTENIFQETAGNPGIAIENPTPATSSVNQSSPTFTLLGQYWTGSATAVDQWSWENVLGSGTNPTSTLTLVHTGSSGATAVALPGIPTLAAANSFTALQHFTNGFTVGSSSSSLPTGGPASIVGTLGLGGLLMTSSLSSLPTDGNLVSFSAGTAANSGIAASNVPLLNASLNTFTGKNIATNIYAANTAAFTPSGSMIGSCAGGATCNSKSGLFALSGTWTASSTLGTISWSATPAAQLCNVSQNGGTTWLGIGFGTIPSTTGFTVTSSIAATSTAVTVQYICTPAL
jgi:hypothetical protein